MSLIKGKIHAGDRSGLVKIRLGILTTIVILLVGNSAFGSDAGTIKGTVRAVPAGAPMSEPTIIAGARITLVNHATPNRPIKTVSNASGEFIFEDLPFGSYTILVDADGLTSISKEIALASGQSLSVTIDLNATVSASVVIQAEEGLLSVSETASSNVVRAETLKTQPIRSETFQGAISLTPGVVRDGNGNDYLKGTRTGQSGYNVNGADVTDPGTGKLAFEIPLEAASTVEVQDNPFSAEYGRFTGGVTNLQTKGGGNKFRVSGARFFPTFHNVFSTKIDSFRPRLTLSGPLVKDRLFVLQSFEYRFTRTYVPGLPKPNNTSNLEGFSAFTQVDWLVNKSNSVKLNVAIFPQRIRNVGLDTFNPPDTTPDFKQRGILVSVAEQAVFKDASFLSTAVSYKTFDVDVYGKSNTPFNVGPAVNSGGYFADTKRRTVRLQFQENYYSRPFDLGGQHSIKAGFEFDHTGISGQLRYRPINIRRIDGSLAERIEFTSAMPLDYKYGEIAAFIQDKWVVSEKITLDYGVRFDRDGVTNRNNFAPRVSFLYRPFKDGRTVVRGGIGLFYDRSLSSSGYFNSGAADGAVNPNVEFEQVPERIVTQYAGNGTTVTSGPRLFESVIGKRLQTPRSVRWTFQLDRGLTTDLTARIGYMSRVGSNEMLVTPVDRGGPNRELLLSNNGRSRYDELQFVLVYKKERFGQWNASYVFSRTRGDLNTADGFLGDSPAFVVRPNEYGRFSFDSPHRILFYGQIDISKKHDIRVAPLVELRSGFPFSSVNERLDFVGPRNGAGRLPLYFSLDLQITKGIDLPFFKDKRARVGVALFNLTNNFNPRDVQSNITSPDYGKFYNSLGTSVKAKFDLDF